MSIDNLKKEFKKDLSEYRSLPFWSWNNTLDENELLKQIEQMKSVNIGGFIMHARTGLKTEYLGEKWFSCIGACLKKAKELNMKAWIYDENGWPSGFVGGKLLENKSFRAQYLEYEVKNFFDETAFSVYKKAQGCYKRIKAAEKSLAKYHTIYLRTSPANTDILNPLVVEEFIKLTHAEYYKRFSDSFGKELEGFFTDEPQYYRAETPYSNLAKIEFEKENLDIKDGLIYLFNNDKNGYAYRVKYYEILNKLYVNNFYKKLYNWCETHNCKLTGHSVEESALYCQMWGGAGVMPTYEYEHIPAIDHLGGDCGGTLSAKQVGSVASQLGKQRVLTETFACSGYDATPKELKGIGEAQYFNGVNTMCEHLYPYSIAGQGKVDHPPIFSKHNNWGNGFKIFNDYFTRLSYILANTKENYDVAVIHPIKNVYLTYIRKKDKKSVKKLENSFKKLLFSLQKNGVTYQFIDETILAKYGKIENGDLIVGNCKYDTVIIPKIDTLAKSSYTLLKDYKKKLLVLSKIKYIDGVKSSVNLLSNTTFKSIKNTAQIKYYCKDGESFITSRSGGLGEFIFIKNLSNIKKSKIRIDNIAEKYKALDIENLTCKNITNKILLQKNDSLILIKDETPNDKINAFKTKDITKNFKVTKISENYLVMDKAQTSIDGINYGEDMPLPQIFETLLAKRYKGKIFIKQTFIVEEKMPLKLIMEKAKYLSVKINDKKINFYQSDFDINFTESNIETQIKIGKNELIYELEFYQRDEVYFALFDPLATESLRNCLYYDTEIENSYVKGEFIVDKKMRLHKHKILPKITDKLYKNGYPFFKGEAQYVGSYDYDGKERTQLEVIGRYVVAKIKINNAEINLVFDDKKEITDYLKPGKNIISVTIKSSLRNLLGAHHYKKSSKSTWVTPYDFTMRGEWKDKKIAKNFTKKYNLVNFGVKKFIIIKTEI